MAETEPLNVFELARAIGGIEDYLGARSQHDPLLEKWLDENRSLVVVEVLRQMGDQATEPFYDFGEHGHLVEQTLGFCEATKPWEGVKSDWQHAPARLWQQTRNVPAVIGALKEFGIDWVPDETKKAAAYAALATPTYVAACWLMRLGISAALQEHEVETAQIQRAIGLYALSMMAAAGIEISKLKRNHSMVFNPHVNLLRIASRPVVASGVYRSLKVINDSSLFVTSNEISPQTSLAFLWAATTWNLIDMASNLRSRPDINWRDKKAALGNKLRQGRALAASVYGQFTQALPFSKSADESVEIQV